MTTINSPTVSSTSESYLGKPNLVLSSRHLSLRCQSLHLLMSAPMLVQHTNQHSVCVCPRARSCSLLIIKDCRHLNAGGENPDWTLHCEKKEKKKCICRNSLLTCGFESREPAIPHGHRSSTATWPKSSHCSLASACRGGGINGGKPVLTSRAQTNSRTYSNLLAGLPAMFSPLGRADKRSGADRGERPRKLTGGGAS